MQNLREKMGYAQRCIDTELIEEILRVRETVDVIRFRVRRYGLEDFGNRGHGKPFAGQIFKLINAGRSLVSTTGRCGRPNPASGPVLKHKLPFASGTREHENQQYRWN